MFTQYNSQFNEYLKNLCILTEVEYSPDEYVEDIHDYLDLLTEENGLYIENTSFKEVQNFLGDISFEDFKIFLKEALLEYDYTELTNSYHEYSVILDKKLAIVNSLDQYID